MKWIYILEAIKGGGTALKGVYELKKLTHIITALQLAIFVFSLLYQNSAYFFLTLKVLLVLSVVLWLIERSKPSKATIYGALVVLPGIWAIVNGALHLNPGVHHEIPVYLLAPISYLIVFRYSGALLSNLTLPALKIICALNLVVFFFLYFSQNGELYSLLADATKFFIQYPDGFEKVNSQQATPLIFLLPVMVTHFYFRKGVINFILVSGCLVMALLIGRKVILILVIFLYMCLLFYALYKRHKLNNTALFIAPILVAIIAFSQISHMDYRKYSDEIFNSFPTLDSLQVDEDELNEKVKVLMEKSNAELAPFCSEIRSQQSGINSSYEKFYNRKVCLEKIGRQQELWQLLSVSATNICSLDSANKQSNYSAKVGAVIRNNQIQILMSQIALAPWLGHGLGYIVPECIRSEQQPWRYEMTYIGMMMNIGIVGVLIFCFVYLGWVVAAINGKNIEKSVSAPLLVGSLFYIICASTNPYIMSVEYIWIYFIPYLFAQVAAKDNSF